jgi:hypothetical protein
MHLDLEDLDPVPDNIEDILILGKGENTLSSATPVCDEVIEYEEYACLIRPVEETEKHYVDNYEEYNIVEKHLGFSESMFNINKRGYHIIAEMKERKMEGGVFKGELVETAFICLNNVVKARVSGTCTLMNELMCLLDEVLFMEVESLMHFYIGESEYTLAKVYYGQDDWMEEVKEQTFRFDIGTCLSEGEIMIILCFVNNYMHLLDRVQDYVDGSDVKSSIHTKITHMTNRIYEKLDRLKEKFLVIIGESIS